jgi:hypothetical protein
LKISPFSAHSAGGEGGPTNLFFGWNPSIIVSCFSRGSVHEGYIPVHEGYIWRMKVIFLSPQICHSAGVEGVPPF